MRGGRDKNVTGNILIRKFDSHSHRKMVYALTTFIYQYKTILIPVCHLMSGVHSIFMSGQSSVFYPLLFISLNLAIFSFYSTNVADELEPYFFVYLGFGIVAIVCLLFIEQFCSIHHSYFKFLQEKMIIKLSMFYSG